jgi:hypothetical protein
MASTLLKNGCHPKPIRAFLFIFFLMIQLSLVPAKAQANDDIIEQTEHGVINWSRRIISAEGIGTPPPESGTPTDFSNKDTLMAAEKQAISHLFDTLLKTGIDASHTTGTSVSQNSNLFSQLESMVMKSVTVKKNYITDGTVHTTKQFSMDGGFFQLILPPDIRQFEPVVTLSATMVETARKGAPYTGLIIDARAIGFKPVIAPVIFSEIDKPVYSPIYISRGFAVRHGICHYSVSLENDAVESRAGNLPLVIKGLKTDEKNASKIIISSSDASKVLSHSENLILLNQCRVVIVTDFKF